MAYMYLILSTRKSFSFPSSRVMLHVRYKRTSTLRENVTPASSESSTSADFRMSGMMQWQHHHSNYSSDLIRLRSFLIMTRLFIPSWYIITCQSIFHRAKIHLWDLTDRDLDKYELKIESEKLGSHRASNPEHLAWTTSVWPLSY